MKAFFNSVAPSKAVWGHAATLLLLTVVSVNAAGQTSPQSKTVPSNGGVRPPAPSPAGVPTPPDYVIGPDDVLSVLYWREKDMSADVTVRPDGKITLPLLNDIAAAGLTPDQLREMLTAAAKKYVEEPSITVLVKAINSRKVFLTGQVAKVGPYPLTASMTVMQLIATAGGLLEYADGKNIVVLRTEAGRQIAFRVNYKDLLDRKNLKQNIELRPGDTVIVP